MEAAAQFVRSMGPARLAAMGAVAATLIGIFAVIIMRLTTPTMVPLYTDLAFSDASAIIRELETRSVPYELRRDGSVVMVPQEHVLRLRMDLAASGLPSGGGIGYEIFDRGETLGATSFVQNVNHIRALEGELSRTIRTIDRVGAARVHLVIPERQLFTRDRPEPSASIVLQSRGDLEAAQIRAVQHLVAAAVQGLTPGRVSVVDEGGRLLADGRGNEAPGSAHMLDERRVGIENRMRTQIEDILASVVGRDRVRVQVAAELDFNRITQTADAFDPESRVLRSSQTREEEASSSDAGNDGVTVGNELPDANITDGVGGSQEASTRLEEVLNYEISRTTTTETIEAGRMRRLTVAVVVDGIYTRNGEGDIVYEPRTQEQLDRIAALVRSSIGFDEARGDSVEVANLRFAEAPQMMATSEPESMIPSFTSADLMRLAELAVLALLGLIVTWFVARPLVRRVLAGDDAPALPKPADEAQIALEGIGNLPQIAGPQSASATNEAIELAQIAGEVQASSLKRVGELIHDNPNEAVTIIRNWIHEPA